MQLPLRPVPPGLTGVEEKEAVPAGDYYGQSEGNKDIPDTS